MSIQLRGQSSPLFHYSCPSVVSVEYFSVPFCLVVLWDYLQHWYVVFACIPESLHSLFSGWLLVHWFCYFHKGIVKMFL